MSKRVRFFSIHFLCSVLIVLIASAIIFGLWYPAPLAKALGVTPLFLMLILIDMVIGPLFGWLVYKEGKKTLKFDLSIVIILQICAFSYGFYTIAQGRPVWVVYDTASFIVVKNSDIYKQNINSAEAEFQHSSWFGPVSVALNLKSVNAQGNRNILNTMADERMTIRSPINYGNLVLAKQKMNYSALPLSLLEQYNGKADVQKIVKKYPDANAWLGLSAPLQDMVVLINKESTKIVKIVDLKPWN